MKVAIVDDSQFMRRMVKSAVTDAFPGAEVQEFIDGAKALAGIPAFGPDLILLDLLMPNLNGFEVLTQLRQSGSKTNIIVVTADVQTAARDRCKELGVSGFIDKPITYEKLIHALTKIGAV